MEEEQHIEQYISPSEMMGYHEKINTVLLDNNVFFLTGEIESYNIEEAIKWITYENIKEEPGKVLTLYINSGGGSLVDCLALIDVMRWSKYPIKTIGIGNIASASFLIFLCGTKGYRYVSKNCSVMFHQYSTGITAKQHDLEAYYKEMRMASCRIIDILKEVTNFSKKDIKKKFLSPTDNWYKPKDLLRIGVADFII